MPLAARWRRDWGVRVNTKGSGTNKATANANAAALAKLQKIKTKEQLAQLLGVDYGKHLVYYLYRIHPLNRYKSFEITKKGGGTRQISAPNTGLAQVQRRLSAILYDIYSPRQGAHGFLRGQSIYTNASQHRRQRFVLNIDLEQFFPSINFGRVRGLFMSPPYSLNSTVSTLLAQICCHDNYLPQGAPTSPIVSNMICGRLDANLKSLAKEHGAFYTRYADDITFSCNGAKFPEALGYHSWVDEKRVSNVGEELGAAISANGFSINNKKTRLLTKGDRQVVTGLVVNKSVNVPRKYIRNLRAALHAWRTHGLAAAQQEFEGRLGGKAGDVARSLPRVLMGRIQYVGYIRGYGDGLYKKLRDAFNELSENKIKHVADIQLEKLRKSVWVIEDEVEIYQGTAFFLKDVGLVTCAHCVGVSPFIYHPDDPRKKYGVSPIWKHEHFDVAVLKLNDEGVTYSELKRQPFEAALEIRSDVTLAGYPQHALGKHLSIKDGRVQSFRNQSGVRVINVSTHVIAGNSGGPLVNRHNRVLGVAFTGADEIDAAGGTEEHGVLPISLLSSFVPTVTS
ncbi:MAG: reverse transcriptase domain-containing protein [Pseudomonadota bacterium]